MKFIILAGGKGTRLGELGQDLPKPLVPIAGKPIIVHQIEMAVRQGYRDVLILSGHMGDKLISYLGDGSRLGARISHMRESAPLGTAGAVKEIENLFDEAIISYGDLVMDIDLDALVECHRASGAGATLAVHPNDHPHDSDLVELDHSGRVTAFHAKPHPQELIVPNLVNAAIYVLQSALMRYARKGEFWDFGHDLFPKLVAANEFLQGYRTTEYIKDVGTARRLNEVEQDILSGRVARLNRIHKRAAIFLDRDGVLTPETGDTATNDGGVLLPDAGPAVGRINKSDYLAVVVTNQPAIAKGQISEAALSRAHAKMEMKLGEAGAFVDRIYVCPHHPERGFPGERPELKIDCPCRKPKPGLFIEAAHDLNIDLARSFVIGDRQIDMEAGRRAGVLPVLVETGYGGSDGEDISVARFPTLSAAVHAILSASAALPAVLTAIESEKAESELDRDRIIVVDGKDKMQRKLFLEMLRRSLDGNRAVSIDGNVRILDGSDAEAVAQLRRVWLRFMADFHA